MHGECVSVVNGPGCDGSEGKAMGNVRETGVGAGGRVSESTPHQCFSPSIQWGVAASPIPVPWVLPCPDPRGVSQGERKPLPKHPDTVSVSRVGACYVASVGRVRVAGACPLASLALACEWAGVLGVRVMRPCS